MLKSRIYRHAEKKIDLVEQTSLILMTKIFERKSVGEEIHSENYKKVLVNRSQKLAKKLVGTCGE